MKQQEVYGFIQKVKQLIHNFNAALLMMIILNLLNIRLEELK